MNLSKLLIFISKHVFSFIFWEMPSILSSGFSPDFSFTSSSQNFKFPVPTSYAQILFSFLNSSLPLLNDVWSTGCKPSSLTSNSSMWKPLIKCNLRNFFLTAPSINCYSSFYTDAQTSPKELILLHCHSTFWASHGTQNPSVIFPSNCVLSTPLYYHSIPTWMLWTMATLRYHDPAISSVR